MSKEIKAEGFLGRADELAVWRLHSVGDEPTGEKTVKLKRFRFNELTKMLIATQAYSRENSSDWNERQ